VGLLPPGTHPGTFLGPHVYRELLGTLAGVQGGQAESQRGQQDEEMVDRLGRYSDEYMDMEYRLSYSRYVSHRMSR
jgi:hypothetical protein